MDHPLHIPVFIDPGERHGNHVDCFEAWAAFKRAHPVPDRRLSLDDYYDLSEGSGE